MTKHNRQVKISEIMDAFNSIFRNKKARCLFYHRWPNGLNYTEGKKTVQQFRDTKLFVVFTIVSIKFGLVAQ